MVNVARNLTSVMFFDNCSAQGKRNVIFLRTPFLSSGGISLPLSGQLIDPARRDAANPRLLDDGHQCLFRGLAGLQETGEVAALPKLGHLQVQRAQTGIESALSIPVWAH